jgi:hypothetical protein
VLFIVPAPYSCEYLRAASANPPPSYVIEMFSFFFFAANTSDEISSDAFEQIGVTTNDT